MTESTLFILLRCWITMRNVTLTHIFVQFLITVHCGSIQRWTEKKMLCIQEVPSGQEFAMLDNITASSGRQTDRTERSHVRASEMEKLGETERTTWRDK